MLTFYHGTMESGKTMRMISMLMALNARKVNTVYVGRVYPPAIDVAAAPDHLVTRFGDVTWPLTPNTGRITVDTDMRDVCLAYTHAFIDEAQFLTEDQVYQLRYMSIRVKIHAFGIRADYRGKLFPGAAALFALADQFVDHPQACKYCDRPACMNTRESIGTSEVLVLAKNVYSPTCYTCWGDIGEVCNDTVS